MPDSLELYRLRERLGFRLSRVARTMQEGLDAQLEAYGLSRLTWCVLSGVGLEGQQSPSDLADHIGVTRPVISRALKTMVDAGLIARTLSDQDGRAREIAVTPAGADLLDACRPLVDLNQKHFLDKLTMQQRSQLSDILETLMDGETGRLNTI
ncbi:MAG: MarR family transcriptional regulator [Paracoccaceae bacterium]